MIRDHKAVQAKWRKRERDQKADFEETIELYLDVAQSWLVSTCKTPIISLLVDQSINLDFLEAWYPKKPFLRMQVRATALMKAIRDSVAKNEMPKPLLSFLKQCSTPKGYLPPSFLTKFEKQRIDIDERGSISSTTEKSRCMMYGFFIIGKVLIERILLKPDEVALGAEVKPKTVNNYKILSS